MSANFAPAPPPRWLAYIPAIGLILTILSIVIVIGMFYGTANAAQQDVITAKQDIVTLKISVSRVEANQNAMAETLKDIKDDIRILRNRKE